MIDPQQVQQIDEVTSKAEFARIVGVHRSRVTRWIAEKKISGDALVGEGPGARVRVRLAKAQLRRHLDIGQRFGNGIDTRLGGEVTAAIETQTLPLPPQAIGEAPKPDGDGVEPIEEKIKREKLEGLQRANRKLAEEEAARAGRYVLADDVSRAMGRAQSQMVSWFEGTLSELATALASKHAIPQRDVLHLLRSEFRSCRERASAKFQAEAAAAPAFVEDDIPGEADLVVV
jgi:hypothetical protein